MTYDHIIRTGEALSERRFHLACGYCTTTSFLFEKANFAVVIDCKGDFDFYTVGGEKLETVKAKRMTSGRECYEDIFITTTDDGVIFRLPDYSWVDHYPDCDGESDRWSSRIDGVNDEVFFGAISE